MIPKPVVSIELLLDAAGEAEVRAEWDALETAGLSSLAAHTAESNRPHVTLLVRPEVAVFDPRGLVDRPAFEVRLGAPLLFGTGERRVLARSVVPSVPLLDLHRSVHRLVGPGEDRPHTLPGAWTPHVTLARRLRTSDLERALDVVGDDILATATSLRRWDAATKTVAPLGDLG